MKNILILAGLILYTTVLFSQDKHHKKIKALKVGYITEQLELTAAEAEVFWPVYNSYDAKHAAFRDEERALMSARSKDFTEVSEKEAKTVLEKLKTLEKNKQSVEEQYLSDLEKVLSHKKILILLHSERSFRKKLLHRMRSEKSKGKKRPR